MKLLIMMLLIVSCQTKVVPISKRSVNQRLDNAEIFKKGRKIGDQEKKPAQVFVRRKAIKIEPISKSDNDGSLFSAENPENYLFIDKPKGQVGDVLDIQVKLSQEEEAAPAGGAADEDKLKDELLALLPSLTPSEENKGLKPLSKIRFKIDRILANGDLMVSTYRSSNNQAESNTIKVEARIERSKFMEDQGISTNDLLDVQWYQRKDGELFERESLAWQDEYTLRFSGFDEAKSAYAQNLDNTRRDISKVADRIRQRVASLNSEKNQIATGRQKLQEDQEKLQGAISQFDEKIKEQKGTIEEQKEIIRKQQQLLDQMQAGEQAQAGERGEDEG